VRVALHPLLPIAGTPFDTASLQEREGVVPVFQEGVGEEGKEGNHLLLLTLAVCSANFQF
jgi:hypothetical protein